MQIANIRSLPDEGDMYVRIHDCPACRHEMRFTV